MMIRPLRTALAKKGGLLWSRGYRIVGGEDEGFFGSGHYRLESPGRKLLLAVTRHHGEEEVSFAWEPQATDGAWFGLASVPFILDQTKDSDLKEPTKKLQPQINYIDKVLDKLEDVVRKDMGALERRLTAESDRLRRQLMAKHYQKWTQP